MLWIARAALVAIGLGLWFWTQRLIGRRPFPARGMFEAGAVLVLRAHYTADVFAAIVTALWAAGAAEGPRQNAASFLISQDAAAVRDPPRPFHARRA